MVYNSNKLITTLCLLLITLGVAQASPMQSREDSLSATSTEVAKILKSGNLVHLKKFLKPDNGYLNKNREIDRLLLCYLSWNDSCKGKKYAPRSIVRNSYFIYYYHLNNDAVVVSYIKSTDKKKFLRNPNLFLKNQYLTSYFSCLFTFNGNRWLLEDGCYFESEDPFSESVDY